MKQSLETVARSKCTINLNMSSLFLKWRRGPRLQLVEFNQNTASGNKSSIAKWHLAHRMAVWDRLPPTRPLQLTFLWLLRSWGSCMLYASRANPLVESKNYQCNHQVIGCCHPGFTLVRVGDNETLKKQFSFLKSHCNLINELIRINWSMLT